MIKIGLSNYFTKIDEKLDTYNMIDEYYCLYWDEQPEKSLFEFRGYGWLDEYIQINFKYNLKYNDKIVLSYNNIRKIIKDIKNGKVKYYHEDDNKQAQESISYFEKLLEEDFDNCTIFYEGDC